MEMFFDKYIQVVIIVLLDEKKKTKKLWVGEASVYEIYLSLLIMFLFFFYVAYFFVHKNLIKAGYS